MFKLFWVSNEDENIEELEVEQQEINEEIEDEWQIAVDIIENSQDIVIISPIAWVDLEDIDISLEENILTISGERPLPEVFNTKDMILRNSECFWGKFSRTIILPENLDLDSIKAVLEKWILYITIKKLKFSSQTIKVEAKI